MFSRLNTNLDLLYQKPIRYQHHGKNLFEGLIPSDSKDKKCPAFKPTFEREWDSILYDTERRLIKLFLKKFVEAISVFDAKMQLEIERSDSTDKILEDLEKKYKAYEEQLGKRRKMKWGQTI